MTDNSFCDVYLRNVVLVTDFSGAGKSTALKGYEDFSYEAMDNVPLELMKPVQFSDSAERHITSGGSICTWGLDTGTWKTCENKL